VPAARADRPPRNSGRRRPRWPREKNWDDHVEDLERMAASPGFLALRDRIIGAADLDAGEHLLDVGAGTGLLTLAAAPRVALVSALDVSPAMCAHLERKLERLGLANVETYVDDATTLPLADASVDVVVSNYCFHHLDDAGKERALAEIMRVLRPGGRLVFGDMMFRLTVTSTRDRAVIGRIVVKILRRGPAGILRLLRNALRILSGRWEHPAGVEWWREALLRAGFTDIDVQALEHEGGIARAHSGPAHASAAAGTQS
jgi:ubiquinone/menaquinone biosynthesis C-methylase UbiE